ncbi:alpha-2Da adrenergic receptor-like [Clavelina lepadiformis]|uniref:alpha-2Da adrenergic receptor-like n=1 Tax=Clavelina lepadiformis TaxID=159417 RepID=UPI004041CF32
MDLSSTAFPINRFDNATTGYFADALEFEEDRSRCLGNNSTESAGVTYSTSSVIVLSILTGLFCLLGLVGNVMVVVAILKDNVINKHIQNTYLMSLAVSDALLVVLVVPFTLTNELLDYWPFGDVYCRIYLSLDILLCTASICNICFIGLDRYISVKYPTTYRKFRTPTRIRLAILFVWIYAAAVSLLPFSGNTEIIHGETHQECFINDSSWFIILSCSLSFFIPSCIIFPVYIKIYMIGRKLEAARRSRRAQRQHVNMTEVKLRYLSNNHHDNIVTDEGKWKWRAGSNNHQDERAAVHCGKYVTRRNTNRLDSDNGSEDSNGSPEMLRSEKVTLSKSCDIKLLGSEAKDFKCEFITSNQPRWGKGEFLSPPTDEHSPRLERKDLSMSCDDVNLISATALNEPDCELHENSLFLERPAIPKIPVTRKGTFSSEDLRSTLVSRLASSTNALNIPDNDRVIDRQGKMWFLACCEKICPVQQKNYASNPRIVVKRPTLSRTDISDMAENARSRLQSLTSVISSRRTSVSRRCSTMSTQSTCMGASRRERRFVFIICVVTGCFMFCWMPFFSTYLIYAVCRTCCIDTILFKVFFWLGYLNSGINPILYTVFNKDFRRAFKRLFCKSPKW